MTMRAVVTKSLVSGLVSRYVKFLLVLTHIILKVPLSLNCFAKLFHKTLCLNFISNTTLYF